MNNVRDWECFSTVSKALGELRAIDELECVVNSGAEVDEHADSLHGAFAWGRTPQGFDFWRKVFVFAEQVVAGTDSVDPLEPVGVFTVEQDPPYEHIQHPPHYNKHPSGVECITVIEHMCFNLGNAVKYIWRCDLKEDDVKDLKKAAFYIEREISKREKSKAK